MKTELKLNSVVPGGVSGSQAGSINLLYTFFLDKYDQVRYSFININQIGEELDECIVKEGKAIHINIKYDVVDFSTKSEKDKYLIQADIINKALIRIAEFNKGFDLEVLHLIHSEIIRVDFSIDILLKKLINKKDVNLNAELYVVPKMDLFTYFIKVYRYEKVICVVYFYKGLTSLYYVAQLFSKFVWRNEELLISDKKKTFELSINFNTCTFSLKNLSSYSSPPFFQIMRADISEEERTKSYKDWKHTLPPAHSAIIDYEAN